MQIAGCRLGENGHGRRRREAVGETPTGATGSVSIPEILGLQRVKEQLRNSLTISNLCGIDLTVMQTIRTNAEPVKCGTRNAVWGRLNRPPRPSPPGEGVARRRCGCSARPLRRAETRKPGKGDGVRQEPPKCGIRNAECELGSLFRPHPGLLPQEKVLRGHSGKPKLRNSERAVEWKNLRLSSLIPAYSRLSSLNGKKMSGGSMVLKPNQSQIKIKSVENTVQS